VEANRGDCVWPCGGATKKENSSVGHLISTPYRWSASFDRAIAMMTYRDWHFYFNSAMWDPLFIWNPRTIPQRRQPHMSGFGAVTASLSNHLKTHRPIKNTLCIISFTTRKHLDMHFYPFRQEARHAQPEVTRQVVDIEQNPSFKSVESRAPVSP
jgi:hypothetical protein